MKNVHLAPQWLVQLEKKLHSLQVHPSFKLFLTMEINPKVSTTTLSLTLTMVLIELIVMNISFKMFEVVERL